MSSSEHETEKNTMDGAELAGVGNDTTVVPAPQLTHDETWAENHALTLEAHAQAIENNRSYELITRILEPRLIAALRAGADALRLLEGTHATRS